MINFTAQQLYDKAQEAWQRSWDWYFHPRTCLFYDYLSGTAFEQRLQYLPSAEEIARQYPNRRGWGTGMEDSAISAGLWMGMICDRFEVTAEETLRQAAAQVLEGMLLCAQVSPSSGFITRSVSPLDGVSHYSDSSRDQYTWHAYGLWRLSRSPLSTVEQRARMAAVMAAVCERLERNVVPGPTNYSICREDGKPGLVDKMWQVDPHEVARLPMIYAIGAELTGESHWGEKCAEYAAQAAAESVQVPPQMRTPYAFLQEQVSLEALYELEEEKAGERWLRALEFVAGRLLDVPGQCRQYAPVDMSALEMDWRRWETVEQDGEPTPRWPQALREEDAAVRQPGEALLAQLMCPTWEASEEWKGLLAQALGQIECGVSVTYSLFYPLAAYWRAVRRGMMRLP